MRCLQDRTSTVLYSGTVYVQGGNAIQQTEYGK